MTDILLYAFIGLVALSLLIYFFQERFIFRPEKLSQDFQFKYDAPFKELNFDIEEGVRINGLHFYRNGPRGLILYFHGNTRSIKGWAKYAKDFYRYNY
ncbi:MAG: alpha/beta hydrolase, partial [Chitinophagaceae bacterium]